MPKKKPAAAKASDIGVPSELITGQLTNKDQAIANATASRAKATSPKGSTENKSIAPSTNKERTVRTKEDSATSQDNTQPDAGSPKSDADGQGNEAGGIADSVAAADSKPSVESLLPSHARLPGEGRAAFWERTRKALRAAGFPRGQGPGTAYEIATREAERQFPPVVAVESPAEEVAEPVSDPIAAPAAAPQPPQQADQGVVGLGNFPPDWPKLPANAQLQQEIAWVTANRLLVRDGTGVNLSRAMSPPPSYSALSWLETSILFPSKFADISVKATAENDDEKEFIRREKLAVEEIRSILKEMLDAKG